MANQTPFENTHNVWHPSISKLSYRHEKSIKLVAIDDILCFFTQNRLVNLAYVHHGTTKVDYNINLTLESIEKLPIAQLYRTHLSIILNVNHIAAIVNNSMVELNYDVPVDLPIGITKQADFLKFIKSMTY